jgi:hypothetical protein
VFSGKMRPSTRTGYVEVCRSLSLGMSASKVGKLAYLVRTLNLEKIKHTRLAMFGSSSEAVGCPPGMDVSPEH